MAESEKIELIERVKKFLKPGTKPGVDETSVQLVRREKVIVFLVAYIMAILLWFIVNLGGSFSINLNIPIEAGNVPQNKALTEALPDFVQASISGNGWELLKLYNDPPTIVVNIEGDEVNLFDQTRQRLSYLQDIDISKVQPIMLSVSMEPKMSKKVPVRIVSELNFQKRYGLVGEPAYSPDSITVTGAESRIKDITEWLVKDTLRLENIRDDISTTLMLEDARGVVSLSESEITYKANVSEFTEGETTVYIRTRDLPRGQNVNYNPSSVTIKYDVPIEQYAAVQKTNPYEVYVPYSKIVEDNTGFVTPDIQQTAEQFELHLRSFQPKAVAYFTVLD